MGFSRSRRRALFSRRALRLTAVVVFFALSAVTAMGSADAAALPQATVRFSGVAAFVKSLFADAVGLPPQASGTAAGKGGQVPTAATRARNGSGRAPGKGVGELAAYNPSARKTAAGKAGAAHTGFDTKSSVRNAAKSNAFNDWFDNADGSYTVKTSEAPVNYRAGDGTWQPLDPALARGADGRLHERASGLGVSFAGGNGSVGSASSGQRADLASPRTVQPLSSSAPATSTGELVSLSLGGSKQLGWSLAGAAPVSPVASGATAEYDAILPDTNLSLSSQTWGVKETFTLASASAPNSWTFPLTLSGVSVHQDPKYGWELLDTAGAVVARLSVPFAYDSVVVRAQHPNTTYAVSYSLTTDSSGAQSLVMTLDKAWLDDPARVFPVTVDPSVTVGDAGYLASTYIEYPFSNNYSSTGQLLSGFSDWTSPAVKARSFIYFSTMPTYSGYHVTQANVGIFDIWAATCSAEPFDVYPVTDPNWTNTSIDTQLTWNNTTYTGPSYGPSMGEVSASPGAACTNNSGSNTVGTWMYPQLDTSVVNQWTATNSGSYHGIQIGAPSETNHLEWKIFDSTAVPSRSPYIYITYTPNNPPQVNSTSPASGYNSPTLTPTLSADASDPDNWPGLGLGYVYRVYDGANDQIVADSQPGAACGGGTMPSAGPSWTVPAGALKWGQSYYWAVDVCDGDAFSGWSSSSSLITAVPPPLLTSNLSQNSSGHGFDPALGNYTTSATDAQVATVGPALAITRDYNSLDPRVSQALGAGWSSLLDARAAEVYDTSGTDVVSVTVTYPDGSEVGFGKNADGSFAPPLGRFATFTAVSGGGYSLTDKNDTVYLFTQSLGSGVYGLTSITDAAGRVLTATWAAGHISTLTSASGRALHLTWAVPSGAKNAHVQSIATDPVTSNGTTAPLTWTYTYQGDQFSSVCPPTSATACTRYQYTQTVSQYRTALLDGGPTAYWPLSDASGTSANDLVLSNEHGKDATYTSVSTSTTALLAGSGASAASFNGTSSQASTADNVLDTTASFTVSAWVDLPSTPSGFQDVVGQDGSQNSGFELQYDATDSAWAFARATDDTANAVSVRAHATAAPALNTPAFLVGVYDAGAGSLSLYVNGQLAGTASYTTPFAATGALTIGRGELNGASANFFKGLISDVAVYQAALPAAAIAQLYTAGTTSIPELTVAKRPSGNQAAQVSYSTVTGRVVSVVDGNGGTWGLGVPSVSGSAEGYRAAAMGAAPSGYWRLGDAAGSTTAFDEVAADGTVMTYYNSPTLGASGPLNSSQSAVTFDGTSQYAASSGAVLTTTASYSISAWVNLASTSQDYQTIVGQSAADGGNVYLEYSPTFGGWSFILRKANDSASGLSAYDYASSNTDVAANTWTHLVAVFNTAGGNDTMSLYVNGKLASSATDSTPWQADGVTSIGATTYASGLVNCTGGQIAEVALYPSALDGATVAAMYAAGKNAAGLNPTESVTVTDPASKTLTYEYDPVNGTRMTAQIDGLGAKTTYGYDTSGFLHTVVDPNGNETITGHDVRGNTVSQTTCQNQATNSCSTSYYTYLPDDATALLTTPSPTNDMLATASDGRSSSDSDPTYRASYQYDKFGDRTLVTTPPVPGYPAGRTATTVYTDGTITSPASDNASKPVPAGLPWTQTSAGGAVIQYHYYASGDLYSVTTPTGGMITTFTYDQLGRPTHKTSTYATGAACTPTCPSNASMTSTAYDGLNRAVTVTMPATVDRVTGNTHQAQTSTVYDVDGNQVSQTLSDVGGSTTPDAPRTSVTHYNGHDQVDWSMDAQQSIDGGGTGQNPNLADATQFSYDAYGNKAKVVSPQDQNGRSTSTDYQHDADGRLLYTTLEGYTGSPSGSQNAANQTLEARTYDPAGRLASVTDAMGFTTFYQYFDDNQTSKITRCQAASIPAGGGMPTCTGASFVQESDSYDGAGDLTAKVTNNGTTETDYAYDASGRQTSSTLDPQGLNRTTSKTYSADDLVVSQRTGDANGSGTTDYQYNADGAMTAQSVENYTTGAPAGWWKLNDGAAGATTPSTAHDWSGQNNPGTLNSGVTWASGAASFDGASGAITTSGPVLDTTASYSISVWVNLASTTQDYQTIVGQTAADGIGNLYLEYSPTFGGWSFILRKADNSTGGLAAHDYASSNNDVAANTWTHLVAVYDSSTGAMQLYVNGALAASATDTTPWQADGQVNIGATVNASGAVNYTGGQIANVQVYQRALGGGDVSTLYTNGRSGTALSTSSNTTTWALDGRNLPISMTDANGQTTNYVYDEAGHRAITQEPAVTTGTYTASGGYTTGSVVPTMTSGYDTFGDASESKDPTGLETTTTFDADGRPTSSTLPDYQQPGSTYNSLLSGQKSKTQYNELGQKTATWDPAGVQSTYVYDQLGHQSSKTLDPGGLNRTASTAYDLDGDTTQVTDPSGAIRSATYDYLGRTLTATQVLGLGGSGSTVIPAGCQRYNNLATQASCTTGYAYTDTAGFLSQATTPSGVPTTYGYDAAGERTSVTDGANQTTSTGYDYAGRAVKKTQPDGTYSTTTYDQAGQITAQAQYDASGTPLRSAGATYDADGNVLSSTDPNGNTSHFTYDAAGRLTGHSQPASYNSTLAQVPSVTQTINTSFGYDASGRQTEYITGNGNHWYTTYDSRGLAETSAAPATTTYNTAATSTTTTTYDADGRPIEQDSPGTVAQTRTYDAAGELLTQSGSSSNAVDAATATRTFTYYPSGLMKTAATSNTATSGSNATSESFTYDDSGALAATSGTAGTSTFTYTADGQMASRADSVAGTQYTTGFGYDGAGRLSSISEPLTGQGLTYTYTPNSLNYIITYGAGGDVRSFRYNTAHELAADTLKTADGAAVASISYGYDANGNETSKTTTGFAGAAANTYTYDQANRLKSWSHGTTVTGYAYDQDSNRTNVAGNTFTYDARDQLTSDGTNTYAYTARGTLQTTTSASGTVTTSSDAYNQQTAAGTSSYTYDALGRVTASGTSALTYSGLGNQIASTASTAVYTRDPSGAIIGVKDSASSPGTLAYTDQHTDLVARFHPTDAALSISTAYDPLGNVLAAAGNQVALGYQSEYTNGGKVNMAARWYNPATGQFISKDTASNNPVPNSASANPFVYGNDNPLTSTDPTGHRACGDVGQCFGTTSAEFRTGVAEAKANQGYWRIVVRELTDLRKEFYSHLPSLRPLTMPNKTAQAPSPEPGAAPAPGATYSGGSGGGNLPHPESSWSAEDNPTYVFDPNTYGSSDAGAQTFLKYLNLVLLAVGGPADEGIDAADEALNALGDADRADRADAPADAGATAGSLAAPDTGKVLEDIQKVDNALRDAQSTFDEAGDVIKQEIADATKPPSSTTPATTPKTATPTTPKSGPDVGSTSVDEQPLSPINRAASSPRVDPSEPAPVTTKPRLPDCHSFTGATSVLMADGLTKPIDQIKAGDKIKNAAPGGGTETHTVDKVIVTTTDHDFAALTITPVQTITSGASTRASQVGNGLNTGTRTKIADAALAAALVAPSSVARGQHSAAPHVSSPSTANLTTTYHHAFYDATTNQWTQAENLRPGDLLQTSTGFAALDAVHLYHANTVTYDLTIGDLHTYYVVAGNTPVLVHNCGNEAEAVAAQGAAQDLQALRGSATNDHWNAESLGTTAVIGVRNLDTGAISIRTGINGAGEAPDSWPQWAKDSFVQAPGHAEEGIINSLADNEAIDFGGTSRNICWEVCYPLLSQPDMVIGGQEFPGMADKSPFRMFWREPGYPDNP